ncbi:hypothetical protein BGI28_29125 [Burkholderia contaminans]|nr:hypothetical protein BGI28_29125 [Burkholderia contaminans]
MSGAGVRRFRGGRCTVIVVARRGDERLRIAGGPAACAPQPPFSTTSATAICGWSTGAYAMNSAWSRRCSASRWPL